jgi:predicted SAM-dependent methyltransferase
MLGFGPIKHSVIYVTFKELRKALLRKIALPKYLGDNHCCPVCGTRVKFFKPIWKSYKRLMSESSYPFASLETFNWQAYSCPACDASDRERLYALYIDKVMGTLNPQRRYRLVEFAPSPALSRKLKRNAIFEYRSADLFRKTVNDKIDITDMRKYRDGSIDIFICSHILEHVSDDRKAMHELFRILSPDGFGIVMVPLITGIDRTEENPEINTRELRTIHYSDGDHVRQYGVKDFYDRLTKAGFQVVLLDRDYFGSEAFQQAGISDKSRLWVVSKPPQ